MLPLLSVARISLAADHRWTDGLFFGSSSMVPAALAFVSGSSSMMSLRFAASTV